MKQVDNELDNFLIFKFHKSLDNVLCAIVDIKQQFVRKRGSPERGLLNSNPNLGIPSLCDIE